MKQLASNNFQNVLVTVNGYDDPIVLNAESGLRLMDFLAANQATHVKITLEDGTPIAIKTTDIRKVEPTNKPIKLEDYI